MIAAPRRAQPSKSILRAARTAAGSQHAQINLERLIFSLEARMDAGEEDKDKGYVERDDSARRDWESVQYARAVLDLLKEGNEQSSSTAIQLASLGRTLDGLEKRSGVVLQRSRENSLRTPLASPDIVQVEARTLSAEAGSSRLASSNKDRNLLDSPRPEHSPSPSSEPTAARRRRPAPSLEAYLAARQREDLEDGEAGLLPLKRLPVESPINGPGARDQLLRGGAGVGSTQLHEELGGQLADMSHRLKLNAIHFAHSLEAEKSLLESSQGVLENNLESTRSSKKHLGAVSSKSRGTTCMTLGIVVLVLVLFIWTYMLIRFT